MTEDNHEDKRYVMEIARGSSGDPNRNFDIEGRGYSWTFVGDEGPKDARESMIGDAILHIRGGMHKKKHPLRAIVEFDYSTDDEKIVLPETEVTWEYLL